MPSKLKTLVMCQVLALCMLLSGAAQAEDAALVGDWQWESHGEDEPQAGQVVSLSFDATHVTVTLGMGERLIAWRLAYTAEDGTLTIQPIVALGEADPATIEYTIEDGKLKLGGENSFRGEAMVFGRGE